MPNLESAIKIVEQISFCDYSHDKKLCTYAETGCEGCAVAQAKRTALVALRRWAASEREVQMFVEEQPCRE